MQAVVVWGPSFCWIDMKSSYGFISFLRLHIASWDITTAAAVCFTWCFQAGDPSQSCEPVCSVPLLQIHLQHHFPATGLLLTLSACSQALPFSIYVEPGTSKKLLRPCSLIVPRLDGAASRVGSYMPWSPGSSFSLSCTSCLLCKGNGYCISALILAVAESQSFAQRQLCLPEKQVKHIAVFCLICL